MPLFSREKSSLKGHWRLETVQDMRSSSSNPVSCSETSIKIYGSKEEIRARKSPETVDAPGFAPDASIPVTLFGPSDRIRTCGILLPKQARYQLRYTRLFSLFIRLVVFTQMWRPTNWATPGYSISAIIPRRGRKSKIFLSVVIYVVKAAFMLFSAIGENPANAGVTRLCGVSQCPVPDTAMALPKQARYQLRYTPIRYSLCIANPFLTALIVYWILAGKSTGRLHIPPE